MTLTPTIIDTQLKDKIKASHVLDGAKGIAELFRSLVRDASGMSRLITVDDSLKFFYNGTLVEDSNGEKFMSIVRKGLVPLLTEYKEPVINGTPDQQCIASVKWNDSINNLRHIHHTKQREEFIKYLFLPWCADNDILMMLK